MLPKKHQEELGIISVASYSRLRRSQNIILWSSLLRLTHRLNDLCNATNKRRALFFRQCAQHLLAIEQVLALYCSLQGQTFLSQENCNGPAFQSLLITPNKTPLLQPVNDRLGRRGRHTKMRPDRFCRRARLGCQKCERLSVVRTVRRLTFSGWVLALTHCVRPNERTQSCIERFDVVWLDQLITTFVFTDYDLRNNYLA